MTVALLQPPMAHGQDDYNRANGIIGSTYSQDTTAPLVINTNRLQITPQASGSGIGYYVNTWRDGAADGKFATDNHELRVQLTSSGYGLATDNPFLLMISCSDTVYTSGINVVFGGYSGGSTASVIQTGNNNTWTTRATAPTNTQVPTNALVRFRRIGNVFTVIVNGTTFLTWTDTGGIVPKGASQRRCRLGLTGNYPMFNQQYQCASIDQFWMYDLAA